MGTAESTQLTSEIKEFPRIEEAPPTSNLSGRKQSDEDVLVGPNLISIDENDLDIFEETESDYSDSDDSDEEEDEEWNERLAILADARKLRQVAEFFMYPEKPVVTSDPCATGRNYFSRPSAPTSEEEEERAQILADAQALKKLAVDYLHPEKPVDTSDPCATGRNYFSRPFASGHEDQIRTEGYASREGYHSTDVYHHYISDDRHYAYHHGDTHLHPEYHSVSDQFEMDEDMSHEVREFRESLQSVIPVEGAAVPKESEEEGKLSRSPSSVMLFDDFDEAPVPAN